MPTRTAKRPQPKIAPSTEFTLEELTQHSPPRSLDMARELLLDYGHFVAAQPNVASFCFGSLQLEADAMPTTYLNQQGGAILARHLGSAAGFVAWRAFPQAQPAANPINATGPAITPETSPAISPKTTPDLASAWEVKRLWVPPRGRGLGIGKMLVQAVIARARAAGKSALYLDTAPAAMAAAYRLYLEMGFTPCAAYSGQPLAGIAYLSLQL